MSTTIDDDAAQLAKELAEVRALKAKLEIQTTVRSEVSDAMRAQQEETRRREFGKFDPLPERIMPPKPAGKLIEMKLERNYAPQGYYEIVGYHKEAVVKKFSDGRTIEVEKAEFIKGVPYPPPPGASFFNKVFAGSVLRFPETEAKAMRKAGIANVELSD